MYDFTIIGGGVVGLSTGMALSKRYPAASILILEKEDSWGKHQTGHNSGVIHSGIYYRPGSLKARFAKEGNQAIVDFCVEHGIEYDLCGKVIVATKESELPHLENLYRRGMESGLQIEKIDADRLKELEPHVQGLSAIHVPSAGIVNYKTICEKFAEIIHRQNGDLKLNTEVINIIESKEETTIETNNGTYKTRFLINCTGLQSDRITKLSGTEIDVQIVPFRGEYYELKPEKRHLVKNLIYPVPNPDFPFLGVHFTRMIGGQVEAGPNAVLSFKREGYHKTDFNLRDFMEVMTYKGFWKLAARHWREGMEEMVRSFSKAAFVRSLQQLIPEVQSEDLVAAPAGVRAQALKNDGSLVDDFYLVPRPGSIHVCNAPSPAATASIPIGEAIVDKISELRV